MRLLKRIVGDGFLHAKLRWLLLYDFIAGFSGSLSGIFLPLYLIRELHFPLWLALTPLALGMLSYGALSFSGYNIQRVIGTKTMFITFYCLSMVHNIFLFLIPVHRWAFWAFLAFSPLTGLFSIWQPYHMYLAKYTNKRHRGLQLSVQSIIGLLAAASGTLIGGLLLTYAGFVSVVGMQYVLMALRIIPILQLDQFYEPHMNWRLTEALRLLFSQRFRKTMIAEMVSGIIEPGIFLWPIFIFFSLKTYVGVGSVISLALLFQVLFILFIGQLTDALGRKLVLTFGTVLNSLIWLGRFVMNFLPKNVLLFLGLETYTSFVGATVGLPFKSAEYDKMDYDLDYRPVMDLMNHLSKVPATVLIIVLLFVFPALQEYLYVYFLLCAVLTYCLPFICNHER